LYKLEAVGKAELVKLTSAGTVQTVLLVAVMVPWRAIRPPVQVYKLPVVAVAAPWVTAPVPVYWAIKGMEPPNNRANISFFIIGRREDNGNMVIQLFIGCFFCS
jgi:hypothetical protein